MKSASAFALDNSTLEDGPVYDLKDRVVLHKVRLWLLKTKEKDLRNKMKQLAQKENELKIEVETSVKELAKEQKAIHRNLAKIHVEESFLRSQIDVMCMPEPSIPKTSYLYTINKERKQQVTQALSRIVEQRSIQREKLKSSNKTKKLMQTLLKDALLENLASYEIRSIGLVNCRELFDIRVKEAECRDELEVVINSREVAKLRLLDLEKRAKASSGFSIIDYKGFRRRSWGPMCNLPAHLERTLEEFAKIIRASGLIRTRRADEKSYSMVFSGSDLVSWTLMSKVIDDQASARIIGQLLLKMGIIYKVETNREWGLGSNYYRFHEDDRVIRRKTKAGWLIKFGGWRKKKVRYYVWDSDRRLFFEFKAKRDKQAIYQYPLGPDTKVNPLPQDAPNIWPIELHLRNPNYNLKVAAQSESDQIRWLRVFELCVKASEDSHQRSRVPTMAKSDTTFLQYNLLRTRNRLKWVQLFKTITAAHPEVKLVRQRLAEICVHFSSFPGKVDELLSDRTNAVGMLFVDFDELFLSPMNLLKRECNFSGMKSAATFSVNDINEFIKHAYEMCLNLCPASISHSLKFEFRKAIRRRVLNPAVFDALFPVYCQMSRDQDMALEDKVNEIRGLEPENFGISEEFCLSSDQLHRRSIAQQLELDQEEASSTEQKDKGLSIPESAEKDDFSEEWKEKARSISPSVEKLETRVTSPEDLLYSSPKVSPNPEPYPERSNCDLPPLAPRVNRTNLKPSDSHNDEYRSPQEGKENRLVMEPMTLDPVPLFFHVKGNREASFSPDFFVEEEEALPIPIEQTRKLPIKKKSSNSISKNRPNPYQPAIDKLEEVMSARTPSDKLRCVVELKDVLCQLFVQDRGLVSNWNNRLSLSQVQVEAPQAPSITNSEGEYEYLSILSESGEEEKCFSSDAKKIDSNEMISLFSYIIAHARLKNLNACISLMDDFMDEDERLMKPGFYITTLKAAVRGIMDGSVFNDPNSPAFPQYQ